MPLARADNHLLSSPFHHAQERYRLPMQPAVSDLIDARFPSLWGVALADRDEDEAGFAASSSPARTAPH